MPRAPVTPLDSLKASFSAHSGHLTRQIRRFERIKGVPHTPLSLTTIQECLDSGKKAFKQLEEAALKIIDLDPTLLDQYEQKVQAEADRFDELTLAVDAVISAANAAAAPPVAAPPVPVPAAPANQHVKVIYDLKPEKLSMEHTPAEFYLWSEAFRAYFSASHLDQLGNADQHAFLFASLDMELFKRIRPEVLPTTPMFTPDGTNTTSVLSLLDDIFKNRYPLVQRRFEFFRFPQAAGQLTSSWISDLRLRGDIADLDALTVDELYAFRIITGVQDADLKDELLKLDHPTLKEVEAAVLLYEAKLSTKEKTSLNRVQNFAPGPGPRRTNNSGSKSSARRNCPGPCGRCNKSGHYAKDCFFAPSITCHQCGRRGHIAPACRNVAARTVTEETEHVDDASVSVRTVGSVNRPTPRIKLTFRQDAISFSFLAVPDSGATRSIVAQDLIYRYNLLLHPAKEVIIAANGDRLRCAGSIQLSVSFNDGISTIVDALVTPDLRSDILLSWHDLKELEILHENFPLPIIRAINSPVLNKLFESYDDVISDTLGTRCLDGPPMRIHLRKDESMKPFKIYTTRQVPLHMQAEADGAVQRALDDGVICRENNPTDWCCRGGFVPKPNGKLRLITDFIPLNKYVLRPVHPFPSALDIIQSVSPDSTVFAVLDCTQGYFQVPLDEASSKLTTFLLPQGRFRYLRAPMGLSASSDEFCRRSDEAIQGIPGVQKLVDDILIQAPTLDGLLQRLQGLLDRCRLHGLTLSRKKAQFALNPGEKVKFAGYYISSRGVQPDPDKVDALKHYPTPKSITELRSFLGMANQLAFFVPDLAHLTARMRLLLKKGIAFVWNEDMDKDFSAVKDILSSSLVVHPFDPQLKTQLLTDASRTGLGFALIQTAADGTPRLIQCGSRSLIPAETRYAIIELECLAVVYAMTKCNYYLRGLASFQLITDHRPLVGLFDKSITDVGNPRIQRFREKIAAYTFEIVWIAGKTNNIADALSRAPHFDPDAQDRSIVCSVLVDDMCLKDMKTAVDRDPGYKEVVQAVLEGVKFSDLYITHPAYVFSNVWSRLGVVDGILVLDSCRLIPPEAQRPEILRRLHLPHLGIVRTRKQAQQLYYWPGMNNQIKILIQSCSVCQMLQPSQCSEPHIHTQATYPMQNVSVDLYEYGGKHYLLMADRFSGYIWMDKLHDQCTKGVLKILLGWYLDYGFPMIIRTDGGPQFRTEFDIFCDKHGITHEVSSPLYPEANGHAEANVKAGKHLLIKCLKANEDFRVGLMELRNAPRDDGYSPAQLFFARRQRTSLPCLNTHLSSRVDTGAGHLAREKALNAKQRSAEGRTRPLSPLDVGQKVLMQDPKTKRWIQRGKIRSKTDTGRSYWIQLDSGKVLWRNRQYLRPIGDLTLSTASAPMKEIGYRIKESIGSSSQSFPALRKRTDINYRDTRPYVRRK